MALVLGLLSVKDDLFKDNGNASNLVQSVLKICWDHSSMSAEPCLLWKTKCFCLKIISLIGYFSQSGSDLGILDLGLQDEAEEVRSEAVIVMPLIVILFRFDILPQIVKRLE